MGFFSKLFKKNNNHKSGFENEMNEITKLKMKMQAAFLSPSFRGIYDFQQDFLPSVFFHKTDQILNDILANEFHKYVDAFKEMGRVLLLDKENLDIEIRKYNENQYIARISIRDLMKVIHREWKTPLCDTIYLYFNTQNPKLNMYYTVENSQVSKDTNYMLCAKNTEGIRLLLGSSSVDGDNFMQDIGFIEIEKRLNVTPQKDRTDSNEVKDDLLRNEFGSFYDKVIKNAIIFDSNLDKIECISFALLINDIKISTHIQFLSFTEREEIFEKRYKEVANRELDKCKSIRDSYSTILSSPNDYVIGQSFNMMPAQDIEIVQSLLRSPYGICLLHFIDRLNYGFTKPEDTKNIVIGDFLSNISKAQKLLILRGELWSEILEFIKE